jgi:hypothetical protein
MFLFPFGAPLLPYPDIFRIAQRHAGQRYSQTPGLSKPVRLR